MAISPNTLVFLADALLVLHSAIVAFVVLVPPLVWLGYPRQWRWVRRPGLRWLHALAMAIVLLQAVLGKLCPLTVWEQALRRAAGASSYGGSFIQHHLQSLLYWSAPDWVFLLVYSLFALLIALTWWLYPPNR